MDWTPLTTLVVTPPPCLSRTFPLDGYHISHRSLLTLQLKKIKIFLKYLYPLYETCDRREGVCGRDS